VSKHDSKVDIVLGNNFLIAVGINCNEADQTITWLDNSVPCKPQTHFTDEQPMHVNFLDSLSPDHDVEFPTEIIVTQILEAKHQTVDVNDVARRQTHSTPPQRDDLGALLSKHTKLFNGKLGPCLHRKLHLDLAEDAKPVHKQPCPVAHSHLEIFKNELEHLVKLSILQSCGASEWAAPTFIVPRKDGRVRWVSDFRKLNKLVTRKIHPLPRIVDVLCKQNGCKFFTKLDVSMQHHAFELNDESRDPCVIVAPHGNFKHNRLPTGIKQSPDFAQEIMEDTLRDVEECDVCTDDIGGAFNSTWEQHLATLERVSNRLQDNNFTVNPLKHEWGVQETDWLGHWLTPTGLKPWKKKIEAILNMERPRNVKEARSFIRAVTFHGDMFAHASHVLTPLTELTKKPKTKFMWTPEAQNLFEQMRAVIAKDVLV
jgi:hypothetical protein